MARLGKLILILMMLSALVVVGYFLYLYYKLDSGVLDTGVDRPVAADSSAKVKPLTMLLLGTDYRPKHKSYLTDVIMVVALNPETESATIVSLPAIRIWSWPVTRGRRSTNTIRGSRVRKILQASRPRMK